MTSPVITRRTPDRPPSKRMQRINAQIAAKREAEAQVHVPTIAAVEPEPVDQIAALDSEIAHLKETITAAQERLAAVETERRVLKIAAVADRLNREFAEFQAEFDIEDTAPLITDETVRDVLARAEKKAQESVIETETTAVPAEVSVEIEDEDDMEDIETSGEVFTVTRQLAAIENPFAVLLRQREAAEATYTTDHGVTYSLTPEPSFAEVFASYEPQHVAAVADGAEARFVAAPDRKWVVAARDDQVDTDTGEAVVRLRDGSETVPIVGDVLARLDNVAVYGVAVKGR